MEKLKSGFEFIFASYKRTAAILFIAALTLAIPITITLVGQQQDIRQRAATAPTPPCTIPASLGVGTGGYGDVNGDGQVNPIDSSLILQFSAGLITLTSAQIEAADVNGPPNVLSSAGNVNSIDSNLILQYVAGLISTFPVCPSNVISGTVFVDNNGNGVQDTGETDYSGTATIKLETGTTATKYGNGYYFTGVASGSHTVTLTLPSGYIKTTPTFVSVTVPPSPGTFKFGIKSTIAPTPTPTQAPTPTPTQAPTPTPTPTTDTIPPTSVITSPAAGSTQTGNFYVSVTDSDNAGVSGLICYYGVTDLNNGFTVERTERPCNSQILITVGASGNCRTEGANKCTVRVDSTDNAGYVASLSFRSFSISYSSATATPTPTPTTPPGVTAAPTPTPTGIPPGTSNLNVTITLTGIGASQNPALGINNNPKRPQRNVGVTIINSTNQQVASFDSTVDYDSATGKYKGNVGLGSNFVSGSYLVKVRLDNTLWKTIPGIQNITSGQTYNAPEAALVSGDIIQNNEINLLDYNALLSCFGTQACATKAQADLNDDDRVEELDLNILYAGFAKRKGD